MARHSRLCGPNAGLVATTELRVIFEISDHVATHKVIVCLIGHRQIAFRDPSNPRSRQMVATPRSGMVRTKHKQWCRNQDN